MALSTGCSEPSHREVRRHVPRESIRVAEGACQGFAQDSRADAGGDLRIVCPLRQGAIVRGGAPACQARGNPLEERIGALLPLGRSVRAGPGQGLEQTGGAFVGGRRAEARGGGGLDGMAQRHAGPGRRGLYWQAGDSRAGAGAHDRHDPAEPERVRARVLGPIARAVSVDGESRAGVRPRLRRGASV